MRNARTRRVVLTLAVMLAAADIARADGPATKPAAATPATKPAAEMTPKERMIACGKAWPTMTPDQVAADIYTANAGEQKLAKAVAKQVIAEGAMQAAVVAKWGAAGEEKVMHAAKDDTAADDAGATEDVDGDHATLTFANADLDPVEMIKDGGVWKMDLHQIASKIGAENIPAAIKVTEKVAAVMVRAKADLAAGKFDSADAMAEKIKAEMEKLDM